MKYIMSLFLWPLFFSVMSCSQNTSTIPPTRSIRDQQTGLPQGTTQTPQTPPNTGPIPNQPILQDTPAVPQDTNCYKGDVFICKIEFMISQKTNDLRMRSGLTALTFDAKDSFVARDWSLKQGNSRDISHIGFPSARESVFQAEFRTSVDYSGENVAYTSGSYGRSDQSDTAADRIAQAFTTMWWNSSGHRRNMLGRFSEIGVGVYQTPAGEWYATQIFQ